jgi:hypothetical protein
MKKDVSTSQQPEEESNYMLVSGAFFSMSISGLYHNKRDMTNKG